LKTGKLDKRTVTGVTMIGGGACDWSQDASGFKIRMPAKKPDGASYAYGFKISFGSVITFDGKPVQVFPVTATEGQGQR
jgi:hypothetical protein